MKAVTWCGKKDVRVANVEDPRILRPHDAIVRVTRAAICGSDVHLYDGYVPTMKKGDILGHEAVGEVVEVGKEVYNLAPGDRVAVPFPISCGQCWYCKQGLWSLCDNTNPNAWMMEKAFGQSTAGVFGYSHMFGGYAGGQAAPITILVDEATAVQPAAVNLLRSLHDDPITRCPLVLADTWRLDAQLHSHRGLPGGYEQLRSRAGAQVQWRTDRPVPIEDVEAVAASVLRSIDVEKRLTRQAVRFLHEQVANRPVRNGGRAALELRDGALRNVMQRLHAVADVAEAVGGEPTFCVAELDYVAGLVGHAQQQPDAGNPFQTADPADDGQARKTA